MMENHELWRSIIEAGGPKRIGHAVGRDISTIYRWSRSPFDADDPDGTGANGLLDWLEAVVDTLAARPTARVTLRKLQIHVSALFARALDRGEARPQSPEQVARKSTAALRELADVIDACKPGDCDWDKIITETLEVQTILDEIVSAGRDGAMTEARQRTQLRPVS